MWLHVKNTETTYTFIESRNAHDEVGVPTDSKSSLYAQDLHKILQTIN